MLPADGTVISLAFCLLVSAGLCRADEAHDLAASYRAAAARVKSYDALIHVTYLEHPDAMDPAKVDNFARPLSDETNRDVFAIGLGRRIEQFVGSETAHDIGVIDWQTAMKSAKSGPNPFMIVMSGTTYHEYYNPEAGTTADQVGLFLADLLIDRQTKVSAAPASTPQSGRAGFRVEHPRLNGPIDVWLDPEHGNMPKKIEWHDKRIQLQDPPLTTRMEVREFASPEAGVWVPAKASMSMILPVGPGKGRQLLDLSMELLPGGCTWNSITNDSLFVSGSLPVVNHEDRGWKFYYPPSALPAVKEAAGALQEVMKKTASARRMSTITKFILAALLMAPLFVLGWKKFMEQRTTPVKRQGMT